MPTYDQIDLLKEQRDRLIQRRGADAPLAKLLTQQISALERQRENRKTGKYQPNPVTFVASMQK